tara:strand:- start:1722 stop:2975 length:1254 start_codon:yes stop_codon:yes gene_type:complete
LTAGEGPLQRLRDRSAESRWSSLRDKMSERREERAERRDRRRGDEEVDETEEPTEDSLPNETVKSYPLPPTDVAELPPRTLPHSSSDRPPMKLEIESGRWYGAPESMPPKPIDRPSQAPPRSTKPPMMAPPLLPLPALPLPVDDDKPAPAPPVVFQESFQFDHQGPSVKVDPETTAPGIPTLPATTAKTATRKATDVKPLFPSESNLVEEYIKTPSRKLEIPATAISSTYQSEANYGTAERINEFSGEIKSIREISPFVTYEPDAQLRSEDPGRHLCPLPEGFVADGNSTQSKCPEMSELPNHDRSVGRNFAHLQYHWCATNTHYYPLYFEDPRAERYGQLHHPLIQPVVSVARFNAQLLGLPYQMAINPVAKCVYPLGYYRPGDVCAPQLYHQIPLSLGAAFVTAEVYTGLFFLFP